MGNYAGGAEAEQAEGGLSPQEEHEPASLRRAGEGLPVVRRERSFTLSESALYLREILASEESLRAAFEPVLRAAWCSGSSDAVDREGFACAVNRIVGYFNPCEPLGLTGTGFGPPYSVDEALGHFRAVLEQLAARLEELERPGPPLRRSALDVGAPTMPSGGAKVPVFSEDYQLPSPSQSPLWRSWQPAPTQPPLGVGGAPAARQPSWSPGPQDRRARAASPLAGGGLVDTPVNTSPWRSLRAPSPPARAPAQVPPTAGGSESLGASLEASRARVAGLRRALGREEELLQHQVEETRRLEHLQRDLEAEAEAAARRRSAAAVARAAARGGPGAAERARREAAPHQGPPRRWPGEAEKEASVLDGGLGTERRVPGGGGPTDNDDLADDALEGPLSLEDVKYHLRTVVRLRRRVVELEGALDGREEQVAMLSDELQRRTACLAVRVAVA